MNSREMSFGERAVGLAFSPCDSEEVTSIKRKFADVIDDLNALRNGSTCGQTKHLASVAITDAQTAHIWAVKAFTCNK